MSGSRFEHQRFSLAGVKNRIEAGRVRRAIACAAVLLAACHLKVDAQQAGGSQPPTLVAFSIGAQHTASLRWRATEQLRSRLREAPNLSMLRIGHNTARAVSSHRRSQTPSITTQPLPLVMAASDRGRQGFVRIINHSDRAGTVDIHAIDDTGRRLGPVSLSLEAWAAAHFNSADLENGNTAKGLSAGVGDGTGNWRLELASALPIEALAYIRTPDGFVTNMHEVAIETFEGSNHYHVSFFNPGRNRNQESRLRLINPGSAPARIRITGVDDGGRAAPLGAVRLTLGAGMARMLSASQLENGSSGLTGRLGAGEGKRRLSVSADRPIQVMSLLQLPTGHLTNLSRGRDDIVSPPYGAIAGNIFQEDCNSAESRHTTMAYSSRRRGNRGREFEYLSSPILTYRGTPTGDAARRDNRRVPIETARRAANHRQSQAPSTTTQTLPLVMAASDRGRQGFVRIINHSDRAGTVDIHAIDDTGRRLGPVSLSLEAWAAAHFNSADLENGNTAKGLSAGVGDGTGNWRLELASALPIEALAYIRTPDGFVTNMHEVAVETFGGSNHNHVPFFNPGRNRNQESRLRLINPGSAPARIEITGVDDGGRAAPLGAVRLTLGAGMARMLSASQLENGSSGLTGRLGAGEGKRRLSVSADRPIQVMSLLQLPTGHLTNLSRGRADTSSRRHIAATAAGCLGISWGVALNHRGHISAGSGAESACRSLGDDICDSSVISNVAFTRCGALVYGKLIRDNGVVVMGATAGAGATRSAAEQDALSQCRAEFSDCRILVEAKSGRKASYCNMGASTRPIALLPIGYH